MLIINVCELIVKVFFTIVKPKILYSSINHFLDKTLDVLGNARNTSLLSHHGDIEPCVMREIINEGNLVPTHVEFHGLVKSPYIQEDGFQDYDTHISHLWE